jgi:hypothetical protein
VAAFLNQRIEIVHMAAFAFWASLLSPNSQLPTRTRASSHSFALGTAQTAHRCRATRSHQLRPAGARGVQGVWSALGCQKLGTRPRAHLRALWRHGGALDPNGASTRRIDLRFKLKAWSRCGRRSLNRMREWSKVLRKHQAKKVLRKHQAKKVLRKQAKNKKRLIPPRAVPPRLQILGERQC